MGIGSLRGCWGQPVKEYGVAIDACGVTERWSNREGPRARDRDGEGRRIQWLP